MTESYSFTLESNTCMSYRIIETALMFSFTETDNQRVYLGLRHSNYTYTQSKVNCMKSTENYSHGFECSTPLLGIKKQSLG